MSEVIGVRVPKKLKEELQELNRDYADEVKACLEKMVKKKKLNKLWKRQTGLEKNYKRRQD
ncbi:MAG: antitoxin [Candidatus Bathyarchaeia archaeon]|jgi:hypothetical protein